ncbi:hypothetical protein RFI_30554, partial [Reticulomyxa filosa]
EKTQQTMKEQLDVFMKQSFQSKMTNLIQQMKLTTHEMTSKMDALQTKIDELASQKETTAKENQDNEKTISEVLKKLEETKEDIKTSIRSNSKAFSELSSLYSKLLQEIEKTLAEKSKEISQSTQHFIQNEGFQGLEKTIKNLFNNLFTTITNRISEQTTNNDKVSDDVHSELQQLKKSIQEQTRQLQLVLQQEQKETSHQALESFHTRLQATLDQLSGVCANLETSVKHTFVNTIHKSKGNLVNSVSLDKILKLLEDRFGESKRRFFVGCVFFLVLFLLFKKKNRV